MLQRIEEPDGLFEDVGEQIRVVMVPDDGVTTMPECARNDRACTDGRTLWVSAALKNPAKAVRPEDVGFTYPVATVKTWTIVVLHEVAHILMDHPHRSDLAERVKETRADCWASRYVNGKK